MVASWRLLMTVVAHSLDASVGLVIRQSEDDQDAILAPSFGANNPYIPDQLDDLAPGTLRDLVISGTTGLAGMPELIVVDAYSSAAWETNPDAKLDLVSYLAYPVFWPDGKVVGTLSVLDSQPRDFSMADRELLMSARDAIQDSLSVADSPQSSAGQLSPPRRDRARPAPESFGLWDLDPSTGDLRMSPSVAHSYCTLGEAAPTTIDEWMSRVPSRYSLRVRRTLDHVIAGTWETGSSAAILPTATGADIVRIVARGVAGKDGSINSVVGVQTVVHADSRWLSAEPIAGDHIAALDVDSQLTVVDMTGPMTALLGLAAPQRGMPIEELLADTVEAALTLARFRDAVQGPRSPQFKLIQVRPEVPPYAAVVKPLDGEDLRAGDSAGPDVWRVTLISDEWQPSLDSEERRSGLDEVTGLPARSALEHRIRTRVARAPAGEPGPLLTLTVLEVSNLHLIVSRVGHQAAEACLAKIAEAIQGKGRFATSVGLCFFSVLTRGKDTGVLTALQRDLDAVNWDGPIVPIISFSSVDIQAGDQRSVGELLAEAVPQRADVDSLGPAVPVIASPRKRGPGSGQLTSREREIVALVADGLTNRAIAHNLFIAVRTVEGHLDRARAKLDLHSRTQLVAWFYTQPGSPGTHQSLDE